MLEREAAARDAVRPGGRARPTWLIPALLVALASVVGWNAWLLTRPPSLPPAEDQAYALRRSAAAVVEEVTAIAEAEGRDPTPEEVAALVDEGLSYVSTGEGFVVTNTDGEFVVTYDGSVPLDRWVAAGGYALAPGGEA